MSAITATGEASPMLAQFLAIKAEHAGYLVFYRMGDFYELFFEDAVEAAEALDIVLTKRGRHEGEDIPMCGVPVHACDQYLERLIRRGFKVAICEQVEGPAEGKKRGARSIMNREVVRLVTPGTLTEDALLDARASNYLAALSSVGGECALAWLELSTGEFAVQPVIPRQLGSDLSRLNPGEILIPESIVQRADLFEVLGNWKTALTVLPSAPFESTAAERSLKRVFQVSALEAFGAFARSELAAAGALVDYIERTQKGHLPSLSPPVHVESGAVLSIDSATRSNLELVRNLAGKRAGSLLTTVDRTLTGAGARLFATRLSAPLTDPAEINARLDDVGIFHANVELRALLRECLRRSPDVERALTRCTVGRGGPRDLAAIRDGLACAGELCGGLASLSAVPSEIVRLAQGLGLHESFVAKLSHSLAPELPHLTRDGGFIVPGANTKLDEFRALRDESRRHVLDLQTKYADASGVSKLKIKHNNVLGYFVEVTNAHGDRLMSDSTFIHRQTMANAVRFSTTDLGKLERAISDAADQALHLELKIFDALIIEVRMLADDIARVARFMAALDVTCALAKAAAELSLVRPTVDDSLAFDVIGGRHLVVEAALAHVAEGSFVPNDCDLGAAARLWLITGPNMAGKSTFLRQNALIVVLAQMGAFVPAKSAHIGVVDRLFSRVGAADDLARGRSTFMVEMVETAAILNQAGPRALVILDEIGRGTSTFDGLSIAWAVIEHLHETNCCRALFATHYHELTSLAGRLDRLANYTVQVKEWQGDVIFLHSVAAGTAKASYGIQVARIAGLPPKVIQRAGEVLHSLEADGPASNAVRLDRDLPLFSSLPCASALSAAPSAAEALLNETHLDDLTPNQALNLLYRIKALVSDGE